MKAIEIQQYGSPEKAFNLVEKPDLNAKPDEVIVAVEGFGLNFADVMARKGLYAEAPKPPFTPGYDVVGKVISVGDEKNNHWINKRVVAMTRFGGYATQVRAKASAIAVIDDDMPLAVALTLATQYVTAYYALEELIKFKPNDTVLVHAGAGGVGLALIALAKYKQLNIIATAGSDDKVKLLTSLGVTAINYSTSDYKEVIETKLGKKALKATFNAIGGKSFKKDMQLLQAGGTVMLYGAASRTNGGKGILPTLKLLWQFGLVIPIGLMMRSISINGINMLKIADRDASYIQEMLQAVITLVQDKKISPFEGEIFPISELNVAHSKLENRQSVGKLGVRWK
jgi:NADPH:quinone reductase-like Zn-dependent oxidoreductase